MFSFMQFLAEYVEFWDETQETGHQSGKFCYDFEDLFLKFLVCSKNYSNGFKQFNVETK